MDPLFDDAWKESETTFPPGEVPWLTLEFRHPELTPPLRIVADNDPEGRDFRLEPEAPVDGGGLVHFESCPFQIEVRLHDPNELPKIILVVDNVARPLEEVIRSAVKQRVAVQVRFRAYVGSDKNNVHAGPLELEMTSVVTTGNRLTATASIPPWQKKMFPTLTFDREVFNELIEQAAL